MTSGKAAFGQIRMTCRKRCFSYMQTRLCRWITVAKRLPLLVNLSIPSPVRSAQPPLLQVFSSPLKALNPIEICTKKVLLLSDIALNLFSVLIRILAPASHRLESFSNVNRATTIKLPVEIKCSAAQPSNPLLRPWVSPSPKHLSLILEYMFKIRW